MFDATDAGSLAEIAAAAGTVFDYERDALELMRGRVGFEVAMFKRASGLGAYTPGLDPKVARACRPYWAGFAQEIAPVLQRALRQRGVAVDVDVLGARGLERQQYYQRLMRPHGGTSTAIVCLTRRGCVVGCLSLGRTSGGFDDAELSYLRGLAPTLSVCEATLLAPAPAAFALAAVATLTSREREVLSYLRLGYTNAEIARALGSAERTVRNQLSSIYRKLGVASRAEAAALCAEHGLAAQ
jgi:DNA-binding CsgD family transcriptional regulator